MSTGLVIGVISFVLLVIVGNILLLKSNTHFESSLTKNKQQDADSRDNTHSHDNSAS